MTQPASKTVVFRDAQDYDRLRALSIIWHKTLGDTIKIMVDKKWIEKGIRIPKLDPAKPTRV